MPTVPFFIIRPLKQEVGWRDLQSLCCSLYLTLFSVLFSLSLSAFGSWLTQTVTLYPPIIRTGIHACEHTNTDAHAHTSHPVITQPLPAAIVRELTVLLSICAATVTAAARGGCAPEGVFATALALSPITSSSDVVARCSHLSSARICMSGSSK